jgi:Rrf2 family nitric oxide-sensitive transcriptional repressor
MRLTKVSDYSLRVLIYLAVHPDRPISIGEISRAYAVSAHVLVKVVKLLIANGSVASVRGRHGGLRLDRAPREINVGALLRRTETRWDVVECFNRDTNTCPLEPACGLKGALMRAQRAFLTVLDDYTVADFLPRAREIKQLLRSSLEGSGPA